MQGEGSPRELLGTLSCRLAYTVWPACNAYTAEKAELGKQTATALPRDPPCSANLKYFLRDPIAKDSFSGGQENPTGLREVMEGINHIN